jgi:oligoribonuclease
MTGLDPAHDALLEIATIVTNYDLEIIARGPVLAIRQSDARLAAMDAWNRRTHKKSGLIDRVRAEGVTVAEAERQTLAFVKKYCYARTAPLCGNSIGQDKRFLAKYMPDLHEFLHYKVVDVSSIKLLAWSGTAASTRRRRRRSSTAPWTTSRSRSRSSTTTGRTCS